MKYDLCVIGGGSGGLSVASAAGQLGVKVALVEKSHMGGDCLHFGCIPSKSLLSFAKKSFLRNDKSEENYQNAINHIHSVIQKIQPHDSKERFEALGVDVYLADASFESNSKIRIGDQTIEAKYFVIATGSSPVVPPILGLDQVSFHTNETIFYNLKCPEHLLIIGGGPIGIELAQAYNHLGTKVTLIEANTILNKDDPLLVSLLKEKLKLEGIDIYEHCFVVSVAGDNGHIEIQAKQEEQSVTFKGTDLLLAVGRKPNLDKLQLEKANVVYTSKGVTVDKNLRTSNKRIYAIGDVNGLSFFTHMANHQAGIVIQNIFFQWTTSINKQAAPWVTYTDPELAHVGLTEQDLVAQNIKHQVIAADLKEIDRALCEKEEIGKIRVFISPRGKIYGVNILAPRAGELIQLWGLMIDQKISLKAFAKLITPYPTYGELNKKIASLYYAPKLFSKFVQRIVQFFLKFL